MAAGAKTLDLILDTIGAAHDINAEGGLLATDGKIVLIGLQPAPMSYAVPNFLFSRHTITGSLIGGMKRTQGASVRLLACDRERQRAIEPACMFMRARESSRGAYIQYVSEREIPASFFLFRPAGADVL